MSSLPKYYGGLLLDKPDRLTEKEEEEESTSLTRQNHLVRFKALCFWPVNRHGHASAIPRPHS